MPFELNSFIKEKDSDKILVRHSFYGETEPEANTYKKHHLASCEYYRAAENEGRTIDIFVEIDELPEFDEQALEEFLELDDDDVEDHETDADPEDEEDDDE
jgi:hypothetical protein